MLTTSQRVCSACMLSMTLVALSLACDQQSPTQPQQIDGVPPVLTGLEVAGPRTVAPGTTGTFTAMAHYSSGPPRDVTGETQWRSNNSSILRFDTPGRGTALSRGDATVTAASSGLRGTLQVIVLPDGTYRLGGTVRVSGAGGGVPGARVEVLDGPERLETVTNFDGAYVLFGVPGAARIRITRSDYVPLEEPVQLTEHRTLDFAITPARPLLDLSGTYTLRITLTTPCGAGDPGPEFRDRTYSATITHASATSIRVKLSGANMVSDFGRGDSFAGTVDPSGATFVIDPDYYGYFYPEIVERLPTGAYFVVGGSASTTLVSSGLVGTMEGWMIFYNSKPRSIPPLASCWSNNIRFDLLR